MATREGRAGTETSDAVTGKSIDATKGAGYGGPASLDLREAHHLARSQAFVVPAEDDVSWAWESDANHRISRLSDNYSAVTGIDADRVIGRSRLELLLKSAARAGDQSIHYENLMARRPFRDFVYEAREGRPECRWVSLSGQPRFGADGSFLGYRGSGRNVSGVLVAFEQLSGARRQVARRESDGRPNMDHDAAAATTMTLLMSGLNAMNDAFCFYDADDRLVLFNDAMCRMYVGLEDLIQPGTTFEELIDAGLARGIWSTDEVGREAFRAHVLGNRRDKPQSESILQFSDGRWAMHREMRTDDGGTIGVCTDITEIKRHEFSLDIARSQAEAARQQLLAAMEALDDGFVLWDKDDRILALNSAYEKQYSFLPDLRVGRHVRDLLTDFAYTGLNPEASGREEEWVDELLAKRETELGVPNEVRMHNGHWAWRLDVLTASGERLCIRRDLTAFKKREEELAAAKQDAEAAQARLQSAMDALQDGFVLWDKDDRLVAFNAAFAKQFAFLPELAAGRSFEELFIDFAKTGVVAEARGREAEWVAEHVASRDADLGREIEFKTHEGRWMLRRDVLTATGDRVGIRTDITEYKQRQEELAKAKQQAEMLLHDLHRSLDTMDLGVVVLDIDLNAEIINKAFYDIWKLSREDVSVGSPFRALMDVNRHNGIYDVSDVEWEDYVSFRLDEIRRGDVAPREFRRADGRTMIYGVTTLSGGKRLVSYYDITPMKEREAQLAEALEKARLAEAVINAVPNPMFVKDAELNFVLCNQAFANFFDMTPERILGRRAVDFVNADEAAPFEDSERRVLVTGELYEVQEDYELDGVGRSRIVRKNRVQTSSDKDYVACSIFDVTDLKRREVESEQSRHYVESVIETLPAGVIIYDKDDRFVLANKKIQEALPAMRPAMAPGKKLREAVEIAHAAGYFRESGDPELDKLYDHDREAWIDGYLARYSAPSTVFERRNPDGRWFKAFDTRKPDGTYVGVRVDITELKEREAALETSMAQIELYKHVLDELPVSTYVKAADLTFEFVNKAWGEITGVPRNDAIGKSDRDFFGEEGQGFAERDLAVLATGKLDETEETLTHRDGTVRHLIAKKSRLVGADGRVHLIGSSTDITELKDREAELMEAQRKAVLADRAKSEFLANMSHEIRTPMNGVMGMAELLAKTELDSRQKTFTDIIVKSGNALLTIINDILDFSKIDAGQLVLDPAPFRLAEAIEDVATLVSTRAKEKDLELIVRVQPGLHDTYVGDVGRIRQIITNLMGNAVKFTDSGHVLVDVTGTDADDMTALRVSVTDTGIGIPEDKLRQVFEKFSQVDASSTRRHEGTGLGLAITSRLVELMGGEMGVTSREGEGSTFWFTISLPRAGDPKRERTMPIDVTGARILVIDDNQVNRSILIEQMTSWGFDACAAASGREGIAVLKAVASHGLKVDCVILDYQMPGMTGADVAREVRETPGIASTPIVMLTSVDQSLGHPGYKSLNIDAHLIKPARSSALLEALVTAIQRHRAGPGQPVAEPATLDASVPLASPAPEKPAPRPELRIAARKTEALHRVDILVAEDNEVNQLVFTQILGETGHTFEIVGNGRLAVESFRTMNPRMILMDVSMPEMGGLEATGKIREAETESGRRVPIVGVTAHALKGDRERCLEAGMDDYLSKPISPKALMQKIDRWIGEDGEAGKIAG